MKKLLTLLIVGGLSLTLAACEWDEFDSPFGDGADLESASNYMLVEINPAVEIFTDDDDIVISVAGQNEDAKTVISALDLEGLEAEEALERYLEEAYELGFLESEEASDDVSQEIFITSDDLEERGREFGESMRERAQKFMDEKGLGGLVSQGITDEVRDLAEEYDIAPGRMRMMVQIAENDEDLEIEDIIEMEHGDIMSMMRDHHQSLREEFTENMRENMRERANEMRERMQERRDNGNMPPFNGDDEDDTDEDNGDEDNGEGDNGEDDTDEEESDDDTTTSSGLSL